jgi:hypothetical protein
VPLQKRLFRAGAGRDGGDDGQLADPVGVHRAQDVRGPFGVNGSWLPGRSGPDRRHDSVRPGQRSSQGGAVEYVCRRADHARAALGQRLWVTCDGDHIVSTRQRLLDDLLAGASRSSHNCDLHGLLS